MESSHPDVAQLRREYRQIRLRRSELCSDPIEQFRRWFLQASPAKLLEPNAMVLGTTDGNRPSSRTVLLKAFDARLYRGLQEELGDTRPAGRSWRRCRCQRSGAFARHAASRASAKARCRNRWMPCSATRSAHRSALPSKATKGSKSAASAGKPAPTAGAADRPAGECAPCGDRPTVDTGSPYPNLKHLCTGPSR